MSIRFNRTGVLKLHNGPADTPTGGTKGSLVPGKGGGPELRPGGPRTAGCTSTPTARWWRHRVPQCPAAECVPQCASSIYNWWPVSIWQQPAPHTTPSVKKCNGPFKVFCPSKVFCPTKAVSGPVWQWEANWNHRNHTLLTELTTSMAVIRWGFIKVFHILKLIPRSKNQKC